MLFDSWLYNCLFVCIHLCLGGVLHCHIPLPAAGHPLLPWSDSSRSLGRTEVFPHAWCGNAHTAQSENCSRIQHYKHNAQHSEVNTQKESLNLEHWPKKTNPGIVCLFISQFFSLSARSSVFLQDESRVLLLSSPPSLPVCLHSCFRSQDRVLTRKANRDPFFFSLRSLSKKAFPLEYTVTSSHMSKNNALHGEFLTHFGDKVTL